MFLTEEMFEQLKNVLIEEDQINAFYTADLWEYHHSLGRYIRNEFKLWENWNQENQEDQEDQKSAVIHPDDLSYIIMLEFQNRLLKETLSKFNYVEFE